MSISFLPQEPELLVQCARMTDQKLMRPPPDAVPFSDEWLAAIESAGEVFFSKNEVRRQNNLYNYHYADS